MKASIFDEATDILKGRLNDAYAELKTQFKGTKPYRKEPISSDEMLLEYNMRGFEMFSQIADTQGIEAATKYRDEMEALKQKRRR